MPWSQKPKVAVITGAGSGIGRALTLECLNRGHRVVATDLKPETLDDLAQRGALAVRLDVNSGDDIAALVKTLDNEGLEADFLINNAGFGAIAPMAEIPLARLRLQFETNVFAVVALCQALVPGMVARGRGRIVNVGSVSGVLTTPFAGAYCASKAAVHAISDAMRMELKPFGIEVITVQPGGIRSDFGAAAASGIAAQGSGDSLYAAVAEGIAGRASASQEGATTAEAFATRMMDAVLAENPAPVVRIGKHSRLLPFAKRYVPTRILDDRLSRQFQLDRLKSPAQSD